MLDFEFCSFKKMGPREASSVLFDYLAFLEDQLDETARTRLLSVTAKKDSSFFSLHEGSDADIFRVAMAFRKQRNDNSGRMTLLWYLACKGHAVAQAQLLTGLNGYSMLCRTAGLPLKAKVDAAIASWDDMEAPGMVDLLSERMSPKQAADNDSDRLVVMDAIGDAGSREGKEIEKRYSRLIGKPLPYRGELNDIQGMVENLSATFPWATNVVEIVCGQLALLDGGMGEVNTLKVPPIMLVGDPGCGKTKFLSHLFQELEMGYSLVPCGGTADSGGLLPVSRGWSTARASGPVHAMLEHGCANPGVILDELDKASSPKANSNNGNLAGALLTMVNGDRHYYDTCLMTNVDFSAISFVATANSLEGMPEALKDRFMIVHMDSPKAEHFDAIFEGIVTMEAERLNLEPEQLPQLEEWELDELRGVLEVKGSSIRQVQRTYRFIIGRKALARHCAPEEVMPRVPMG